ncbi:MAG: sulfite exporter TauE/SafE family protein [Gemmatimonadota bacterium]
MTTALLFVAVGLTVGLLSGLVGIGGGVLMVPFLYFFYDRPDLFGVVVSPESRVALAHGTSLMVIVPTSIRGTLAFQRAKLVEWRAVWPIGAASVLAAFAGARLAVVLPPEALKTAFGVLLIFSGARLMTPRRAAEPGAKSREPNFSALRTVFTGVLVGLLSALLGVGGGTVAIPLLIYLMKLDIRKVAATSIGIIALTASAGTIGYVLSGLGQPGLPPWSLGYVDVSAGIAMFVGALVSVRWGATLNQRLRPRTLSLLFGALFILVGLRLAGGNLISLLRDAGAATGIGLLG